MKQTNNFTMDVSTIRAELMVDKNGADKKDIEFLHAWIEFLKLDIVEKQEVSNEKPADS